MTTLDIDTRTDIYSLGVVLYELLAGKRPFDNHELLTAGVDEMRRIIREKEPDRPSTRAAAEAKRLICSQSPIKNQKSKIDADLDWIVMKCIEKDRTRRYETANGLAADLHRHLNSEPVLARPPSTTYRFQKMLRRHRSASLAIALVTCAVLSGAILSTWALIRENASRKQSDQRLHSALRFTDEIFTDVAAEIRRMPGAVKAQEKLGEASLRVLQDLRTGADQDPTIREALAKALIHLSRTEGNIGEGSIVGNYEASLQRAREAADLFSATAATVKCFGSTRPSPIRLRREVHESVVTKAEDDHLRRTSIPFHRDVAIRFGHDYWVGN